MLGSSVLISESQRASTQYHCIYSQLLIIFLEVKDHLIYSSSGTYWHNFFVLRTLCKYVRQCIYLLKLDLAILQYIYISQSIMLYTTYIYKFYLSIKISLKDKDTHSLGWTRTELSQMATLTAREARSGWSWAFGWGSWHGGRASRVCCDFQVICAPHPPPQWHSGS